MKWSDNAEVLYCDNHVVVASKPCGLLTQPNDMDPSLEAFIKAWVKQEYQKQGDVFLHSIHRLDLPVSGLVLFARTSKALSRLNEQSRMKEIQKVYIAEVEGFLPHPEGQLDHYLVHGDHRALVVEKEAEGAKHARLFYKTIQRKLHGTLLSIELETGRYHQIRAQLSAIGHPIVGDERYGSHTAGGDCIHLHCHKLSFCHPVTKEILNFESAAPFV